MSRHRSRQRRIAPWITIKVMLFNFAGTEVNALWHDVTEALNGRAPDYWYWGHIHNGAVYNARQTTDASTKSISTTRARLCGHAAIPFGKAKISGVEYYAHTPAEDKNFPKRVKAGFATVSFDGPDVKEAFYDEDGNLAWSSQ